MKGKKVNEILLWFEYMECAKHAVQGTVINNKIKQFLMVRVTMKYGK